MGGSDKRKSEVSQKIRAAIQAKLTELGSAIDDELPDYIMVMIANKKTTQQMTDDLKLFLGKNAPDFTKWLTGILERLKALSKTTTPEGTEQQQVKEEEISEPHVKKKKEKLVKSSKKEKKAEKVLRKHISPPAESRLPTPPKAPKIFKSSLNRHERNRSPVHLRKSRKELNENHDSSPQRDKERIKRKKKEKYRSDSSESSDRRRSYSKKHHKRSESPEDKERSPKVHCRPRHSPIDTHRQHRNIVLVKPYRKADGPPTERQEEPKQSSRLFSVAMKNIVVKKANKRPSTEIPLKDTGKQSRLDADIDDDRSNSTLSERSADSAAAQGRHIVTNKDDAEGPKFVVTIDGLDDEFKKRLEKRWAIETTLKRENILITTQKDKEHIVKTIDQELESETNDEQEMEEGELKETSLMSRRNVTTIDDKAPTHISPIVISAQKAKQIAAAKPYTEADSALITMREPLPPGVAAPQKMTFHKHDAVVVPSNPMLEELKKKYHQVTLENDETPKDLMPYESTSGVTPQISINVDEEDDDDENDYVKTSYAATSGSAHGDEGTDTYVFGSYYPEDTHQEDSASKIPTRCHYWPYCQQGAACKYVHPTIKCRDVPNCAYGAKCQFLHPLCKFSSNCARITTCIYTHVDANRPPIQPITEISAPSTPHQMMMGHSALPIYCRYGKFCTDENCPFTHAETVRKPCRFGKSCKSKGCPFIHNRPILIDEMPPTSKAVVSPGQVPTAPVPAGVSQFKWVKK